MLFAAQLLAPVVSEATRSPSPSDPVTPFPILYGTVVRVAGSNGDGAEATRAWLSEPEATALDSSGNLLIADTGAGRIRRVDGRTGRITTIAGGGNIVGDVDNGRHAILRDPAGLAVDSAGNVYIAETGMARILKLSASTGSLSTIAGGGRLELGDGGPARDAQFLQVSALALSPSGDLFIADPRASRVRRVSAATGVITTVAGNGFPGFTGDSGIATAAQLDTPNGLTVDKNGNLFIADSGNNRIRRVDAVTGIITTVAGNGGFGFSSDGGPATSAELALPIGLNTGLATDPSGNLFITDTWTNRIRRVDAATGIITTIAGNGDLGFSDDGGPATSAELAFPTGLTVGALESKRSPK